jgi:LIM domain.
MNYLIVNFCICKQHFLLSITLTYREPIQGNEKVLQSVQIFIFIFHYLNSYFPDWNDLFTTKCFACGFPIEAGDRWVEALNNNYHSLCFNCSVSFFL